jgi:hypothetical protein
MGKPNSHQPLELWDVYTSRSGIEALPKPIIEGFGYPQLCGYTVDFLEKPLE